MKKICIVFPYPMGKDFMSGGVTKLVIQNVRLASTQYETHLILPLNNEAFKDYIQTIQNNITVHLVDFDFISSFCDTSNIFKRTKFVVKKWYNAVTKEHNLIEKINEIHPDIVHLHAEVCCMFLPGLKKQHYKVIMHTSAFRISDNSIVLKYTRDKIRKYATAVISPTKSINDLYVAARKYVVENPLVNTKTTKPLPLSEQIVSDHRLKFVFTGRICRVKQIHYMIEAFAKLPEAYSSKVSFYIIGKPNNDGDIDYQKELFNLVDEHKINNVYFLGYQANVQDYLQYSDIGVLLTKSEAISMSCVEYMFNRLPVLGFDNPGINEAVVDNLNGLLIQNADVEGITNAIITLSDSPERVSKMKENAFEYAQEHFSVNTFNKNILKIYEDLLNDR